MSNTFAGREKIHVVTMSAQLTDGSWLSRLTRGSFAALLFRTGGTATVHAGEEINPRQMTRCPRTARPGVTTSCRASSACCVRSGQAHCIAGEKLSGKTLECTQLTSRWLTCRSTSRLKNAIASPWKKKHPHARQALELFSGNRPGSSAGRTSASASRKCRTCRSSCAP